MAMKKQFTKTQWNNDREPAITAEQLNRMEKGIDDNDTRIVELDKAVTANKTASDKSLAEVNKTLQKHTEDITAVQTELTSQSKAIGELADKKITKFYASSQGDSTLSDSDDGKMQDMMLYGKSEQKQYSGKNLLNATMGSTTVNGISCTKNADGTYTFDGTATKFTQFAFTNDTILLSVLETGKNYKIVFQKNIGSEDSFYSAVQQWDSSWEYIGAARDLGNGATFSKEQNTAHIRVFIQFMAGTSVSKMLVKPMITTDLTATYDDFEPYVGGIPSPNPDYPQEIKSVVEPVVKVTGKNLAQKFIYGYINTINKIQVDNDSTGFFAYLEEGENYTISCNETLNRFKYGKVDYSALNNPNGAICENVYTENISFKTKTFESTFTGYAFIYVKVSKDETISNSLQLEKGSTATAYEPYREQSVTLTSITLNAIPVSSGGNVTIDGQQYISDYVDVERGKIVRRVTRFVLDGSSDEAWSLVKGTNNFFEIRPEKVLKYHSEMLCNVAIATNSPSVTNNNSAIGITVVANNAFRYRYEINNDLTLNDLFERLSSIPMVVYAELATPTEESLSDELAEKLKALQTYYPQTNLFITSNQLDGYAIFNYPISLANGWNYVKQQIGDTRDYIYDMDLQMAQAYVNSEYAVALTELEV